MDTMFPSKGIALLMAIGFLDLILTAILHANGLITEMNPFMRVFIEYSEFAFALVKSATLIAAWVALAKYAKVNLEFVNKATVVASGVYGFVWVTWFLIGSVS